jgi:CRP-like cAMP-binding protein
MLLQATKCSQAEFLTFSRVRRHEKRLARALLILARYGKNGGAETLVPKVSQETLAELVGTTRSRVNFFMNKFRKLGFIHYNGGIRVHNSLLNVVLHD